MDIINKIRRSGWAGNEELIYSILCVGIAVSLIFWPLLNSLFCIAIFAYWLVFSEKKISLRSSDSRWAILFSLMFFISVIGIFYSSNLKEGIGELQKKSALLLFPLIFGLSRIITPLVFKRTLTAFTWATFLGCFLGMVHGVWVLIKTGSGDHLYGYNLIVLKDTPPFTLGLCCILSLVYVTNKLFEDKAKGIGLQKLEVFVAVFFVFYLFLLGNRNLLLCMSLFFIFYCFKLISGIFIRLLLISLFGLVFITAIFLNPYLNRQWHDLTDFSKENNIELDKGETLGRPWGGKTIRLSIWKCSMDVIRNHWIAGVGTGDVQAALQEAYEKRKFYFASRYNTYNAHNQYIQQTLGHGLIGLAIFVSCIFLPFLVNLKEKNIIYTLFLVCFALVCVTESTLELNKGVIWYSFFNSVFMFRKF